MMTSTSTGFWEQYKTDIVETVGLSGPKASGQWVGRECPLCGDHGQDLL